MKIRIDVLCPVTVDFWDKPTLDYANGIKSADVDIFTHHLDDGIASIECDYDMALAAPYTVAKACELEKAGSQAVIIACFAEPALAACKEKLHIPVIGIREAAIAMASVMGNRIGIIAPIPQTVQTFARGVRNKVEKIISVDMPVLDYLDAEKLSKGVDRKVKELVEAGCDSIILGCSAMYSVNLASLHEKYNVPVIYSLTPAIYAAEYMVKSGLGQSKITYPYPPEK